MARTYKRDSRGRFAGGGGGGKKPKTAAGRASANLRAAEKARVINPYDKKAANKAITAAAAKDYYKTMGGGRKGAAKPTRKAAAKAPSVAERKQAMVKRVSSATLAGKGKSVSSSTKNYVRAQQSERMRTQGSAGKGSKAARRASNMPKRKR